MAKIDALEELNRGLNAAQRAAAAAADGPHLVIAGAGSGKTRTLIYRVANLVLRGVRPESILLLTFTRRAAQEMLRRATGLIDERCRRVAGGTFHSFANQVLRRYAKLLGYTGTFTILDRSDAADLVAVLRSELRYDRLGKRFPNKNTLIDLFSRSVNTHKPIAELVELRYPQFEEEIPAIEELAEAYAERKHEQNVMDYDDLLVHLRDLLADHEKVRKKLSNTHRYVLIDEYQDTNRLQAHIAALLASEHGNLMVVGDDAQSIYSFRGADFRNIIDFPKIFPDCKTTFLEQNYRSTQPILDLGNAILESAKEKFEKRLFTEIEGDAKPLFVRTGNDYDQAAYVAEKVLELREEGVPLGAMAILARASWHLNQLEIEFQNRNVPFRKFGGIRLVEAAHVKDVCSVLKIAANPTDAGAWFRVLQLYEGIGPATARRLTDGVIEAGGDFAVLTRPITTHKKYGPQLAKLAELLARLAGDALDLEEGLALVVEHYEPLMPKKYDDFHGRLRDLESLQVIAGRYDEIEEFLSDLAIDPPEFSRPGEDRDPEEEWVTLSTIHSAKGLEWHTVFVLHLNAGHFPTDSSLADAAAFEEERRLLYVAVTRAKRSLFLLKPEEVSRRWSYGEVVPVSPLISDIAEFDRLTEEDVYAPGEEDYEDDANDELSTGEGGRLSRIQDYFAD